MSIEVRLPRFSWRDFWFLPRIFKKHQKVILSEMPLVGDKSFEELAEEYQKKESTSIEMEEKSLPSNQN